MTVLLNATATPLPAVTSAALWLADAYASANGTAPASRNYSQGETTTVKQKLNENAARLDLSFRYGGGVYRAVATGLTITASGLVGTVAAGQAVIDGVVELRNSATVALTDNARNFIWLRQGGSLVAATSTTAPNTDAVYLGNVNVVSGTPAATDLSGVVFVRNGLRARATADSAAPGDTLTGGMGLYSLTAGGLYLWDGAAHQQAGVAGAANYWGSSPRTSGDATLHDAYYPAGGIHWSPTDRTNYTAALANITTLQGQATSLTSAVAPLDTTAATAGYVLQVVTPGSAAVWDLVPVHHTRHNTGNPDAIAPADIGAAAASHVHAGTDITSGTVAAARLPSATTGAAGIVTLAASGVTSSGLVVQGSDARLSDARTPSGAAGGDLNGTYPNPTVDGLQGRAVASTAPSTGDCLIWDGSQWTPGLPSSAGSGGLGFPFALPAGATGNTWTNQPSGTTELFGATLHRVSADLTKMATARITVNVSTAGVATTARLKVQYSTNGGSSWADLGATDAVGVMVDTTGTNTSGWKAIATAAKADVLLRIVGVGGDGATDPVFGSILVEFRPFTGQTLEPEDDVLP